MKLESRIFNNNFLFFEIQYRRTVAECLPSSEARKIIFCFYSPRLKRLIIYYKYITFKVLVISKISFK